MLNIGDSCKMATLTISTLMLIILTSGILTHGVDAFHFPDAKQGEFVRSLHKYDIVVPQRVDQAGSFLSHNVHHHLDDVTIKSHVHRRDVSSESELHYKLHVEGQDLHVSLEPNHKLFGPGLVVERKHSRYTNGSKLTRILKNKCHFIGHVKGHERSRAAIATCEGLTGMVHTDHGEYFIEPVKGHKRIPGEHHPHVVYRRTSIPPEMDIHRAHLTDNSIKAGCGVDDTFEKAEKEREKWEEGRRSSSQQARSGTHHRSRRSVSRERQVETLVVVDKRMMEYYKDDNVETYVLTIMNMVSKMYHDVTIGNAVNIVLVRVMYLEEDDKRLHITHHADNTLNSFCKWQHTINPKDEIHPNHHDVAILLTRYNICSRMNEPCSTLGLSQVSGMCQPHRSCNINEDTGLVLAYTVAHEIGHNFAMKHDTRHYGCEAVQGKYQLVMSPQLSADSSPLIWSNCSRRAVTKFLDRDWGYCLNDEPSEHDFQFPVLPPGVMYNVHHQCRLQYGPEAVYCEGIDEICATLWCQVDNKCLTRLEAPAEGTRCGKHEWCESGQCVTIGDKPGAIDGSWGEWSSWSACSRSCGGGVSVVERHCNNPAPSNGGKYCLNHRKRYQICNTEPCEEDSPTFRSVQCKEFNVVPYKGETYHWEPVSNTVNPCQLHCKPKEKFFSVMLRDIVEDGTNCRPGTRDMCISGLCRHVGCDWAIDSNATEDRCGVCHGDGSSCTTVKDQFTKPVGLGYVDAKIIPAGARNIRVEEVAEANNYLAVKNEQGKYYLNGHWVIQWSGDFEAGGTIIHYQRDGNKESFNAAGPLKEPLHIMLLFQSQNPGVKFEFTVPNENGTAARTPEFHWKHLDWTHCTASCGGGSQRARVVCLELEAGEVDNDFCNNTNKPDDHYRSCNTHQCPAKWWTGPWQHCSVTCGRGVHRRTVICTRSLRRDEQIALNDDECEASEKPSSIEPCHHERPCPVEKKAEWTGGPWSMTCMGDPCDIQRRRVVCSDRNSICDVHNKPPTRRQCSPHVTCGKWLPRSWSKCSQSCGGGVQRRDVRCVAGEHCPQSKRPPTERPCKNIRLCPTTTTTTTTSTLPPPPTTSGTLMTTLYHHPQADGIKQSHNTHWNSINKNKNKLDDDNSHEGISDGDVKLNQDDQGRGETGGIIGPENQNVKEKTEAPPTESSMMSTPFKIISSWLGFGEGGSQEETGGHKGSELEESFSGCRWMYATKTWSECSAPCDGGEQTLSLSCIDSKKMPADKIHCHNQKKPVHSRPCNTQPCLPWSASPWNKCSTTCGEGQQKRQVKCPMEGKCDPSKIPESSRPCHNPLCIDWVAGPWSQCSLTCGAGEQIRNVQCVDSVTLQAKGGCHPYTKPTTRQKCNTEPCLQHSAALSGQRQRECRSNIMSYHLCRQLKRQGRCKDKLIEYRCCKTCQPRPKSPQSPPLT